MQWQHLSDYDFRPSRARLRLSTLTLGSPRRPSVRPSTWLSTNARTCASGRPRAFATRGTWKYADSGEMCGSRPLPDVVTRSIGTGAEAFSFFNSSTCPLMRSIRALFVGPMFEPIELLAL